MTAATTQLTVPDIDPDGDTLTAALKAAAAGIYVLPIECGSKNAGRILGKGWHHKTSRDPKVIASWFAGTNHGHAWHAGRSGLLVADVDHPELVPDVLRRHLDAAPFQNTRPDEAGRGHYIFAMPPGRTIGNSTGRLAGGWGDVRGLNGVIVVAPNPDGRRWVRTGLVPVLPDGLAELLPDASAAADAASDAVVRAFIAEHQSSTDPAMLTGLTSTLRRKFEAGESRHTSTISVLTGAMKEAGIGLYTPRLVLDTIWPLFLAAVTREPVSAHQGQARSIAAATDEFRGVAAWAVGQALGADPDDVRKRVRRVRTRPYVHYGQTMRKVTR